MSKFATYFDRESWPKVTGTINDKESLTDQSFKSMCEIEQLLVNYRGTPATPVYDMNNYETAHWTFEDWQNEKARLQRKYLNLTPEMREKFKNVQSFLDYCSNPENYELKDGEYKEKDIPPVLVPLPADPSAGDPKPEA